MDDIKVSIVIPVYNPGELLKGCLDSASNQTLKDIEIICIDDGSVDGSLDMLNQYAKNDSRFKVFTQSNLGAGMARNKGLEYANGEYIVFLDSDDHIELDMCESLYYHAKSLDCDLVLFDNRWYLDDNVYKDFIHSDSFDEKTVFDYHLMKDKVLNGYFAVIWTKFYKKSFLSDNDIVFPSHKMYNDTEFHIQSVLLAKRISYYPKVFYHYNKSGHPSLQTKYVGKKEAIVFYDVIVGIRDFLTEKGFMDEFRSEFLNFSFEQFQSKIKEMEEDYKNEFFLMFKDFFESLFITSQEFNQMNFRNLPIYIHILNSNSYDEFKLRMELFDIEILNPKDYPYINETYKILKDSEFDEDFYSDNSINANLDSLDFEKELAIEKSKNDANDFYIMSLEDILSYKNNQLNKQKEISDRDSYFNNLKKTTDEYYRIKENYRFIQDCNKELIKENKELIEENTGLKNEFSYKFKNLFKKISSKHKQLDSKKNGSESIIKKQKSSNGYERTDDNERKLESQNKQLLHFNNQLKKENERLEKLNTFSNFQEFLANSYVSPIINMPFYPQDKRVFAFMDHISKYLTGNTETINEKPLVSIIMYTYNGESSIQNAIDSVFNQRYENWELIVIDDGSTDDTLSLLNQISEDHIKFISFEKNQGVSFAYNAGLKEARGEYIMYLDSRNEWDSRYIETMIGAFIELSDADAIYSGQLLYPDYNCDPCAVRFGSFNKPLLHNKNYIDMSCFSHKKQIFDEIGGFDESTELSEWDYILRISNKFKIYSVPVLLSKFYKSGFISPVGDESFDYYEESSKILNKNSIPPKEYQMISHKVSIIIPNYESLNELKECIETILSFDLKDMADIIVVDNNSSIEVKKYLKKLESKQIKLIFNDINYGFTYAVKQAIELSDKNSDILILNNDSVLTEGAIEHMQFGSYNYKDCGLIVPHELVSEKNPHMNYHVPYADSEFKCDVTPSKEHGNIINVPVFHDGGLLELNFAPFFCVYIKREVYDKTLGLDPELGRHYRSDRIFSDFVRHILKLKIYQEPNAYVYHKHKVATNSLRKNKDEYDFMFDKNQWPPELAKELGYKKALWDV